MRSHENSISSLATPVAPGRLSSATATPGSAKPAAFAKALQQAQTPAPTTATAPAPRAVHTVESGDTLIGVVRQHAEMRGIHLSGSQEMRLAQQVANSNRIENADLVYVGQKIDLSGVGRELQALRPGAGRVADTSRTQTASAAPGTPVLARKMVATPASTNLTTATPLASAQAPLVASGAAHPVLQKTLDRAVAKGFIPPAEKSAVYDKILQMAGNHRFSPDDFARMTLMESDGMNPRASNQRCHGIIQFCDGPARGAASAGYAANPKAILDLSVHKQLNLVDKYFDDVGLKNQGPAGLEDLYLSVLNPASRAESKSNAPLNIQGQQARALHVGRDGTGPITRHSIRQGLLQNAAERLGQMLPNSLRVQAQRAQQYVENNLP